MDERDAGPALGELGRLYGKGAVDSFEKLFYLSPLAMYLSSIAGPIIAVNDSWLNQLGFSREEVVSRGAAEMGVVSSEDRGRIHEVIKKHGRVRNFEIVLHTKSGELRHVVTSVDLIELGGKSCLLATFLDITDLKRAEDERQRANQQLEQVVAAERAANEALRQAQSALVQAEKLAGLGQMVAGVAHEINNPLSFVSNNTAVLRRDFGALHELLRLYQEADPWLAEARPELWSSIRDLAEQIDLAYVMESLPGLLDRSRDGLKRIQQIVKDLRDFARVDEAEYNEVDLNAGVESTVNIVRGWAKKRGVEIEVELGALPPVWCHPTKINQVVMNLVANAIDASPSDGRVTVRTLAAGDGVHIEVIDRGTGIDPQVRGKIFDPFFTTKPLGKGTGLGLSISYGIVKDHGGAIDVESQAGQGAKFTVRLPRRSG